MTRYPQLQLGRLQISISICADARGAAKLLLRSRAGRKYGSKGG